jgi:hypothetical protein
VTEINLVAVDPGDIHQGVASFELSDRTIIRHWTRDLTSEALFGLVELAPIDVLVVEEYRLYPEFARQQGYSDFPTCETIGVLKYLACKRSIPIYMQGASIKKKSRRIGERIAPGMGKERMIGSGRSSYWGWDYGDRTQHERDATAHGVWWTLRNQASPLFECDYVKNGGVKFREGGGS